jgi:hypothetical protein
MQQNRATSFAPYFPPPVRQWHQVFLSRDLTAWAPVGHSSEQAPFSSEIVRSRYGLM